MEALLVEKLELHVVEGIILPNLNMQEREQGKEVCGFLNEEGRCSIHPYRPGICRIFPLGRYYENGSFCHVGMITAPPVGGYLQTVEGNVPCADGNYKVVQFTQNQKRTIRNRYVYGYGTPSY